MMKLGSRLRTRLFTALLASQFKEFGLGSRIVPPFTFSNLNQMRVGEGVLIQRDCWLTIPFGCGEEESVKIILKSRVSVGKRTTITAARQVVIEEDVMLGANCLISDHFHAFNDVGIPIAAQGIDNIKPILIGRETWIGNNASIQAGVTIGRHCVIGTNSVVTASIPDFSVAVGMPARVVKTLGPAPNGAEKVEALAAVRASAPGASARPSETR